MTDILKAADIGLPGLHESLNKYFQVQTEKIDATSKDGRTVVGLLGESRGEAVARQVKQGTRGFRAKDREAQAFLDGAFENFPGTPKKRKAIGASDQRATVEDYDDDMDIDEPVASGSGKKAIKAAPPKEETTNSDDSDSSTSSEGESSNASD